MPRQRDTTKINAVYNAALKIVLKSGFADLKMADVAKEAGVATGTLYIYFTNKEELINQLYLHLKKAKVKKLFKGFMPDEPFFVNFKRLWFNYFHISFAEPERMIFIEQYQRSSWISSETKQLSDELLQPMIYLLETGQQQYILCDVPPQVIMSQIMGAINESIKFHLDTQIPITKQLLERYFEMSWNSIRR